MMGRRRFIGTADGRSAAGKKKQKLIISCCAVGQFLVSNNGCQNMERAQNPDVRHDYAEHEALHKALNSLII